MEIDKINLGHKEWPAQKNVEQSAISALEDEAAVRAVAIIVLNIISCSKRLAVKLPLISMDFDCTIHNTFQKLLIVIKDSEEKLFD